MLSYAKSSDKCQKSTLSEDFLAVRDDRSAATDLQLVGELSSSLGASSLKNFSAVSSSHSLSEAMFLFSLSLLGLVCSLHDSHLLVKLINVRA